MKFDWIDPERGPTPQQLGAYADGELSADGRDAIDAWLQRHPDHSAEIDELRRLTQLWHDTPPPSPNAEAWSGVRNKIEAGLNKPTALGHGQETMPQRGETMPQRGETMPQRGETMSQRGETMPQRGEGTTPAAPKGSPRFGLLGAAAAILAVVMLGKSYLPVRAEEEPYPVVDAEDVAILSITGDDCACLVGAEPPIRHIGDDDLALQRDVVVLNYDSNQADPRFQDEEHAPLMFTPPAGWEREP